MRNVWRVLLVVLALLAVRRASQGDTAMTIVACTNYLVCYDILWKDIRREGK